ncbi:MAG: TraR/DksA family transcriptional regulator [Planctomycetota bacterium]|nr:MAG: TraR/DksA family transcriptional regulator [Planctomycetota bacterium]
MQCGIRTRKIACEQQQFSSRLNALWIELVSELEGCQSEFKNHSTVLTDNDNPSERTSQNILTSTINHLAGRVREVDAAINRISSGLYGICIDCNKKISQARLKANPSAVRCLRCQAALERIQKSG